MENDKDCRILLHTKSSTYTLYRPDGTVASMNDTESGPITTKLDYNSIWVYDLYNLNELLRRRTKEKVSLNCGELHTKAMEEWRRELCHLCHEACWWNVEFMNIRLKLYFGQRCILYPDQVASSDDYVWKLTGDRFSWAPVSSEDCGRNEFVIE